MEKGKGGCAPRAFLAGLYAFFFSAISLFSTLGGCAAPSEPTPRRAKVPQSVSDLSAEQTGDSIVLSFMLPRKTEDHRPLDGVLTVKIFRQFEPSSSARAAPSMTSEQRPYVTLPAEDVARLAKDGRLRFASPVKPEEEFQRAGGKIIFMVRTQLAGHKESEDSNLAVVALYPAPAIPQGLAAEISQTAVALQWNAVTQNTAGGALDSPPRYRIFRWEQNSSTQPASAAVPNKSEQAWNQLAEVPETSYGDMTFEFGKTYSYKIQAVELYGNVAVTSADSQPLEVTPKDTFPPAAPQGLVAVVVPASSSEPPYVALSWAVSPETDLAGYNVYRSEQGDEKGQRMNGQLLLTPTYRDAPVAAGHSYFYTVTAVDRAANESPGSIPATVSLP